MSDLNSYLEGMVSGSIGFSGGGGGTSDYTDLENKPKINNVELNGNKTTQDLNISYADINNKPSINNVSLVGNKTTSDLHISYNDLENLPSISSGNNIYYGFDIPENSANNGDLYLMLDRTNKLVATYLYMINHWILIDGEVKYFDVLYYDSKRNSNSIDSYIIENEGYLICINQNMNGEATTKTLDSSITIDDGTILYSDAIDDSYSAPNRNQYTKISIIHANGNSSISMENSTNGNYTTQLHIILRFNSDVIDDLTLIQNIAKADNNISGSITESLLDESLYLVCVFQCRGTGAGSFTPTLVSTNNTNQIENIIENGSNESLVIGLIQGTSTLTLNWSALTDYATKGYFIYKLT